MKIARVFLKKTSMSPVDGDCYFDIPGLFTPKYDEVHISVTFTWDLEKLPFFIENWEKIAPVKIGGPAIDGEGMCCEFEPGVYLRPGVTVTSRGCPNRCPWCFVKTSLKELEVKPGNNVIDNNLLACSPSHLDKVFEMLSHQKDIIFSGGLDVARITDKITLMLRRLRLKRLYIAYDSPDRFLDFRRGIRNLLKYLQKSYIYCYVLIGFHGDSLEAAEERLKLVWSYGAMPFAMRYRTPATTWKGTFLFPGREWNLLTRKYNRPAITRKVLSE
ncbi:MAG: hypothetical protein KAW52_00450 [candidate division Zixibacteria bacterium]|nr:hypothetical protein [candidate division Zixibacteria bacterium]